jgi:hypothetical protein
MEKPLMHGLWRDDKGFGRPREITNENLLENFKVRCVVDQDTGCWLWVGTLDKDGYGQVDWAIIGKHLAHRLSWKLFRGPLDDGEKVLHSCDVPRCVNPDHLFKGDHLINMEDMVDKGRQAKGEDHGSVKLTEAQAIAIINDSRNHRWIAFDYGITRATVSRIKRGELWKHLDREGV